MKDTKNQNTNEETYERDLKGMERITCAAAQLAHTQFMNAPTPVIYLASWIVFNVLIAEHFAYSLEDTTPKEALEMLVEGLKHELTNMDEPDADSNSDEKGN